MDATCKVQNNIHVFRLIHNMCPGFWVHISLQASFFLHKNDGCTLIIYDLYVQLTSGVKTIDSFYFHQI